LSLPVLSTTTILVKSPCGYAINAVHSATGGYATEYSIHNAQPPEGYTCRSFLAPRTEALVLRIAPSVGETFHTLQYASTPYNTFHEPDLHLAWWQACNVCWVCHHVQIA
jgi:hypothetical protein